MSIWKKKEYSGEARDASVPKKLSALFIAVLIIAVAALGAAAYFYNQAEELKRNPQKAATEETERVIASVSTLIVLPEGEQPTIATVTDIDRLKDQPFFANAKVGDKVLIYTNARKAILYDPVQNKIVEVAPLNIGDQKK